MANSNGWADGKERVCGFDLGGGKKCEVKSGNRSVFSKHRKIHNKSTVYKCNECPFKSTSQRSYEGHKHLVCSICEKSLVGTNSFRVHNQNHPTLGKTYSLALERAFDDDQETLAKGRNLAQKVQDKFGTGASNHDFHFHVYLIMFPFESLPESLKEFVDGALYAGHGQEDRHYRHSYQLEPNSNLRKFYGLCYEAGVHPLYFKPFQNLTATQSAIIESAIIKSIDVHNLANENYGSKMPKVFDAWTMDDLATLGAYYLHEAFQIFKMTQLDKHERLVLKKAEIVDSKDEEAASSKEFQSSECVQGKMNVADIFEQLRGMSGEVKFVVKDGRLQFELIEDEDIVWDEPPVKKKR